jgi:hypothetical protein
MDKNKIKSHLHSFLVEADKKPIGLSSTEKVQGKEKSVNNDYYKEVTKKMGAYDKESTDDGDSISKGKLEKTDSEEMDVNPNGMDQIQYDNDPGEKFKQRAIDALEGSSMMGNKTHEGKWDPSTGAGNGNTEEVWGASGGKHTGKEIVKAAKAVSKKDARPQEDAVGYVPSPSKTKLATEGKTKNKIMVESNIHKYVEQHGVDKASRALIRREMKSLGIEPTGMNVNNTFYVDGADNISMMLGDGNYEKAEMEAGGIASQIAQNINENTSKPVNEANIPRIPFGEWETTRFTSEDGTWAVANHKGKYYGGYAEIEGGSVNSIADVHNIEVIDKEEYKDSLKESLINEGLSQKGHDLIDKWISELDYRGAAQKLIDSVLNRMIMMSSSDLGDTATFANGLDTIEDFLIANEYDNAFDSAKETAKEMVSDEGGGDMFENKKNNEIIKESKMKRLKFNESFNGLGGALQKIPAKYKVDNKVFEMTDGNENYRIKWEGTLTEGEAVVLIASDKKMVNEDIQHMKHLMGFKAETTLGTPSAKDRLAENNTFRDIMNMTNTILTEGAEDGDRTPINETAFAGGAGMGFSNESNLDGGEPLAEFDLSTTGEQQTNEVEVKEDTSEVTKEGEKIEKLQIETEDVMEGFETPVVFKLSENELAVGTDLGTEIGKTASGDPRGAGHDKHVMEDSTEVTEGEEITEEENCDDVKKEGY